MILIKNIYRKLIYGENNVKHNVRYDSELGLIHDFHTVKTCDCSYIASPIIMARKQKRAVKYKPIEDK